MLRNYSYLIMIAVSIVYLVPSFFSGTMFLDGLTYGAVSKNLSQGLGSYFQPHYSDFLYSNFYEHPPLFFWVESVFHHVFGHALWVDRLFGVLLYILSVLGVRNLAGQYLKKQSLWPWAIVLLAASPIFFWTFSNNMLEMLMIPIILYYVYWVNKYLRNGHILFLFFSVASLLLLLWTKGPFALIFMIYPLYYLLFEQRTSHLVRRVSSFIMLLFATIFLASLLPEISHFVSKYYNQQIVRSLSIDGSYFNQIWNNAIKSMSVLFSLILIVFIANYIRNKYVNSSCDTPSSLIVLSVTFVLSMVVSPKFHTHYLSMILPVIALLIIVLFEDVFNRLGNFNIKTVYIVIIGFFLLSFSIWNNYKREPHSAYTLSDYLSMQKIDQNIGANTSFCQDYNLHAVLQRFNDLSVDCRKGLIYEYAIDDRLELENYMMIKDFGRYKLFKLK